MRPPSSKTAAKLLGTGSETTVPPALLDFGLVPMKLKVWAGVIVSCAHDYVPPWWSVATPAVQPVTPGRNGNLHANRQGGA
jgi:hypothetical protein